jgi:hypothetical protein
MVFKSIPYEDINGEQKVMGIKEYIKDQIPSVRFWLMLKLRSGWGKRYEKYMHDLSEFIKSNLEGEDAMKNVKTKEVLAKIERGAWNTMPASFLQSLGIPRVQRF